MDHDELVFIHPQRQHDLNSEPFKYGLNQQLADAIAITDGIRIELQLLDSKCFGFLTECQPAPYDDKRQVCHVDCVGNLVAEWGIYPKLFLVFLPIILADGHCFRQQESDTLFFRLREYGQHEQWQHNRITIGHLFRKPFAVVDQDMQDQERLGVALLLRI